MGGVLDEGDLIEGKGDVEDGWAFGVCFDEGVKQGDFAVWDGPCGEPVVYGADGDAAVVGECQALFWFALDEAEQTVVGLLEGGVRKGRGHEGE